METPSVPTPVWKQGNRGPGWRGEALTAVGLGGGSSPHRGTRFESLSLSLSQSLSQSKSQSKSRSLFPSLSLSLSLARSLVITAASAWTRFLQGAHDVTLNQ